MVKQQINSAVNSHGGPIRLRQFNSAIALLLIFYYSTEIEQTTLSGTLDTRVPIYYNTSTEP